MKPIRFLIYAALLCWLFGLMCIGSALLRWHRGEAVAPDGAATVPILLYKDALAVIHVMHFHVVPACGLGFLAAATLISVYLYKNWKHDKPDA
jgi:hypothetical protein